MPISTIFAIDRSIPFDPVTFLGEGWSIAEQDERSLVLAELDLSKVQRIPTFRQGEPYLSGEELLARLKEGDSIRLDARVFQSLWENQELIPEEWKEGCTLFWGTILRSPSDRRSILYLYWRGGGWCWSYDWLGRGFGSQCLSAVLDA